LQIAVSTLVIGVRNTVGLFYKFRLGLVLVLIMHDAIAAVNTAT